MPTDRITFLLRLPETIRYETERMQQALHRLHELLEPAQGKHIISLEIAVTEQKIGFYLTVDKAGRAFVESQMYAYFPQIEMEEVPDPLNHIKEGCRWYGAAMAFQHSSLFPLKPLSECQIDPLVNVLSLFGEYPRAQTGYLQLLLSPAGKSFFAKQTRATAAEFSWLFHGKKFLLEKEDKKRVIEEIKHKSKSTLFNANLRLLVASNDKDADILGQLKALSGSFKPLERKHVNKLVAKGQDMDEFLKRMQQRSPTRPSLLLTVEETAGIYHFPREKSEIANVHEVLAKRAEPPAELPVMPETNISYFAETNFRNRRTTFGLRRVDRRRHVYIIGKSGTGKSKLLELFAKADLAAGEGVALIDPHGDLARRMLDYIPKNRVNDVIYFDATDTEHPIAFNLLGGVRKEDRQIVVDGFVSIFQKLFASDWSAALEHLLRYAVLGLLETDSPTLPDIGKLLTDAKFRQKAAEKIQADAIRNFWSTEFISWSERNSARAVVPLLNKLNEFTLNPLIHSIVSQPENRIDFGKVMNEGKIFIANLAKGHIGEANCALLGSMLVTKFQEATLARSKIEEEDRRDFYMYVDEFQNFATNSFAIILSEARKFRFNLILAHQYLDQLPESVYSAIFGNVGSMILFRLGSQDAKVLEAEFNPPFVGSDMTNLNVREIYLKISIAGKTTPPFSATTLFVPDIEASLANDVIAASRAKYSGGKQKSDGASKTHENLYQFPDPTAL